MKSLVYPSALFLGTLALFWLTLSPTISLQGDSGEFAVAVFNLGIPHPPGYPSYILLAKLFTLLFPSSQFIFALNFFSALMGALSALLLFLVLDKLTSSRRLAIIMALFFSTSLEFWFHSTIIEVYTLNIFFILLTFFLLLKKVKPLFSLGLVMGLGIGVHYFFLVLIPFFLLYLFWSNEKKLQLFFLLPGFLIGVATLLYIPLRAGKFAPLNTLNVDSPERMTKMLLFPFNGYPKVKKVKPERVTPIVKSTLNKMKRRALEKVEMVKAYAKELTIQFNLLVYLAALLLLFLYIRLIQKKWQLSQWHLIFSLLFLYTSLGFLYFTGFKQNSSLESEMTPQYITSYLFFILFVTLLLRDFLVISPQKMKIAVYSTLIILLLLQLKTNFSLNNMGHNDLADRHAQDLLTAVDPNGILIVSGDNDLQPLQYFQYVLNRRPDVMVINAAAVKQHWYYENLRLIYPQMEFPAFEENFFLGDFLASQRGQRPIFLANIRNLDELKNRSNETVWNLFKSSFYPYQSLYRYYANFSDYQAILPTLFNTNFTTPLYTPDLKLRKREQTVVTNYMMKKYIFGKQLLLNGKKAEAMSEFKRAASYPTLDIELNRTLKNELLKELSL